MIEEGTAAYNAWVESPIPVYTKFDFFDMINPSDLFQSHEKPILEERGPYTFRHLYTYQLYNTVIKLVGNSVQEFGGSCRRSALAGGKRVFDDLIQKKRVFDDLNH